MSAISSINQNIVHDISVFMAEERFDSSVATSVATLHADIDEISSVPRICSVFVQKTSNHQGAFTVIPQQ